MFRLGIVLSDRDGPEERGVGLPTDEARASATAISQPHGTWYLGEDTICRFLSRKDTQNMKVYTKAGDMGQSQLPTGLKASKGDIRFEALGQLDELNSLLGWCRSEPSASEPLQQDLLWVQDRIMTFCAQLAVVTVGDGKPPSLQITQADTTRLEAGIDRVYECMSMPASFVIPGGCEVSCRLHLARTACRRAERLCHSLSGRYRSAAACPACLHQPAERCLVCLGPVCQSPGRHRQPALAWPFVVPEASFHVCPVRPVARRRIIRHSKHCPYNDGTGHSMPV